MSLSQVDVCNLALSRAGGHRITQVASLGEASNEARQCAVKLPQVTRTALREHPWRFATKRAPLALVGTGNGGFQYRYQYPTDCLLAREIERGGIEPLPFETDLGEDGTLNILCDRPDAVLIYTAEVTDPNVWDALFYDALAWQLAAELAVTLGNDGSKGKYLEERAAYAWDKARTADAREMQEKPQAGSYILARD